MSRSTAWVLSWIVFLTLIAWFQESQACIHCKYKPRSKIAAENRKEKSKWRDTIQNLDEILDFIDKVSAFQKCPTQTHYEGVAARMSTLLFEGVRLKTELVARILGEYYPRSDEKMLRTFVVELFRANDHFYSTRMLLIGNGTLWNPRYYVSTRRSLTDSHGYELDERRNSPLADVPWLREKTSQDNTVPTFPEEEEEEEEGVAYGSWTDPYFLCSVKKWIISYTTFSYGNANMVRISRHIAAKELVGVVSSDVDLSDMDINQCDAGMPLSNDSTIRRQVTAFFHTHKCHNQTSQCYFTPGGGWMKGSYQCICRDGFYSATGNPVFNGTLVEAAWRDKMQMRSPTYDMLYICKKCQEGCDYCVDDSPCLSHYNWAFRISLLTISVICIILTMVLAFYVYVFRKLKVIKVASPVFLCITLLGCAIMYSEMAAIFPVLERYSCIATKWTRHMGFCLTYSALLLKTWRVSLTYRVKSAHKLKLTDKQLLQWLFPILLVMAIYLGTWTISAPPEGIYIEDWDHLKFKQCEFNWWDHSLAIGEILFLLWGIRVCYSVRNAESFFNEARHISIAIYNITICNIVMVMIHVAILPSAGPDVKYLFGFVRTQLSTTVTVILIFGPKFYRVLKGQGDTWDNRARARGVTASFSLNGVGLVHDEPTDLYQENEELKEEIQKLAAQIEFMRIVHMEVNNRHLKPKHGSFFCNQSPITKSIYMKFESTDSPGSRISPAAELVSERV